MTGGAGSGHLGARLSALVDGQLGHADRDRVLAHLARCPGCRREAAEQRAVKARLDDLDVRAPGGLESRLLALPVGYPAPPVPPPADVPAPRPLPGRVRPPAAALGALLLVGVGVVVLGPLLDEDGPTPPRRDPGQPGLVVEHATATTRVPLTDPAVVGAAWTTVPVPAPPPAADGRTSAPAGAVVPVGASVRGR